MRILILGAGAVGGYFGGRLLEKGKDVTFLVREQRQRQIAEQGLKIKSIHGDLALTPKTIVSGENIEPYDLILLTPKAYHLDAAIEATKPYVGEASLILPLLNGYKHFEILKVAFGSEKVLGGLCFIESTLNEQGDVVQTSQTHRLLFGDLTGENNSRLEAVNEMLSNTKADLQLSKNIIQDIWHKYLFITTLSGITTLMRSAIGPIRNTSHGQELIYQLIQEAASIMRAAGAPVAFDIEQKQMEIFNNQADTLKASMLRDMEKTSPIEADHIQGYLLNLAETHGIKAPLLSIIYHNLKVYELNKNS